MSWSLSINFCVLCDIDSALCFSLAKVSTYFASAVIRQSICSVAYLCISSYSYLGRVDRTHSSCMSWL